MITSKERVLTAFAHKEPDRVPARCGSSAVQTTYRGMSIVDLKAAFGSNIVFNGATDSHHILVNGTLDFIREKTREVLDVMKPEDGYIAGATHDSILEETPVENVVSMFAAIRELGNYK